MKITQIKEEQELNIRIKSWRKEVFEMHFLFKHNADFLFLLLL